MRGIYIGVRDDYDRSEKNGAAAPHAQAGNRGDDRRGGDNARRGVVGGSMSYQPGYYAISNHEYHADPATGSTMLKAFYECPARYNAGIEIKRAPAMALGSAVHCLALEPDKFDKSFAIEPECDKRTKAGKELAQYFAAGVGDREIITETQHAQATEIVSAIYSHSEASQLLLVNDLEIEKSGFYLDDESGLICKFRPDGRSSYHSMMVDLKTTSDASLEGFKRSIVNFGYHISAAHYLAGDEALRGEYSRRFILIAVETLPPYPVAVYQLSARAIEEGFRIRREALNGLAMAKAKNIWPSYNNGVAVEIDLPGWAYKKEEWL